MANNLESNVSTKVLKVIMDEFESSRVLTKTVNTSVIAGSNGVTNETGDTVYLKRAPDYSPIETVDGDISALAKNELGIGRIPATVQNFITIPIDYTNLEEVTELNQLREILAPAASALVARAETNLGAIMMQNAGLTYGTPGTAVDAWSDVSGAGALMQGVGVPMSDRNSYYVMNPFANSALSAAQTGLNAGDQLVRTAWEQSMISANFGGFRAMSSNALTNYQEGADAGTTGTLGAGPDGTWATHKDTMIQTLALGGLTPSTTDALRPGDVIQFTGTGADARSHINVKNKQTVIDNTGAPRPWTCTVVTGGDTDVSGDVTVTVTNAAIYGETGGLDEQNTNISASLKIGDAFTILGAPDSIRQSALFYHKNAFAYTSLKLPKLHATDTIATTQDGLSMRVTKYSDGDKNAQRWRLDMLPVIGVVNPLFVGKGFGV